jgi:hypothetical protein
VGFDKSFCGNGIFSFLLYCLLLKDNKPVSAPLHLSRENLNFAHKKPDWLADKLRETSASEDSDDESFNDSSFESGHNNQGYMDMGIHDQQYFLCSCLACY